MPGAGHTKEGGDPMDSRKRKVEDFLGTDYSGTLSAKVKGATLEDIMQAHGFVPPNGRAQNPLTLTATDLTNLVRAITDKTGWTYGGPPGACCCTWA